MQVAVLPVAQQRLLPAVRPLPGLPVAARQPALIRVVRLFVLPLHQVGRLRRAALRLPQVVLLQRPTVVTRQAALRPQVVTTTRQAALLRQAGRPATHLAVQRRLPVATRPAAVPAHLQAGAVDPAVRLAAAALPEVADVVVMKSDK
jgi:hypothetical protein